MRTVVLLFLFLLIKSGAISQSTITGKITDEWGKPLTGVNVYLKDTYFGATTDTSGHFNLMQLLIIMTHS